MNIFNVLMNTLDFYGTNVTLRFQEKKRYTTTCGGFVSIIIILLTGAGISWYGEDLINKKNPNSLYIEQNTQHPERIDVSREGFPFAIGIEDPLTYIEYIDPSIFTVSAEWKKVTKKLNETSGEVYQIFESIQLKTEPCTVEHFQQQSTKKYFKQLYNLQSKLCISIQDHLKFGPLHIEGDFTSDYFAYIIFHFKQCSETQQDQPQNQVQCKSQQEIDQLLNAAFFTVYYSYNLINCKIKNILKIQSQPIFKVQNLEKPFDSFGRDFFTPTSNKLTQYSNLFFRTVDIESDVGWLFQDKQIIKGHIIGSEITDNISYRDVNDKDSFFQQFAIRCEKSKKGVYKRSYKKVQNLIAEIGGLMKVLVVVGGLLCLPIVELDIKQELVNQVYRFQGKNTEYEVLGNANETSDTQVPSNGKPKYEYAPQKDDTILTPNQSNHQAISILRTIFTGVRKIISLSGFEYLFYYVFPSQKLKNKKKVLDYSFSKLCKHLDSTYLMRKLMEIDQIKLLLLTENQRRIFEILPRPIIDDTQIEDQEERIRQYSSQLDIEKERQQPVNIFFQDDGQVERKSLGKEALQYLKTQDSLSAIDEQILSLIDPYLVDAFQEQISQLGVEGQRLQDYNQLIISERQDLNKSNQHEVFLVNSQKKFLSSQK